MSERVMKYLVIELAVELSYQLLLVSLELLLLSNLLLPQFTKRLCQLF